MVMKSVMFAVSALLLGATTAAAVPLVPVAAKGIAPVPADRLVEQVHHKPGHLGGRGRHLGWYKGNRGKKKGWRR